MIESSTGTKSNINFEKGFPGLITCNSNAMENVLLHKKKNFERKLICRRKNQNLGEKRNHLNGGTLDIQVIVLQRLTPGLETLYRE